MSNLRRKKVVVLNNVPLVDCAYVSFCDLEASEKNRTYEDVLSNRDWFRVMYLKRETIDNVGLEIAVARAVEYVCRLEVLDRTDFCLQSPIPISDYPLTNRGTTGRIINEYFQNSTIANWRKSNKALDLYGPGVSLAHVDRIAQIDILPCYYIESICFEQVRFRKERPQWFIDFIRKLKNERFDSPGNY